MRSAFELVLDKKINLFVSPALTEELKEKFDFFGVSQQVKDEVMLFLERRGILLVPSISIQKSRDRNGNFLLEFSETAQADYLVTRDNDLLVLNRWKETVIIKPEGLLPPLEKNETPSITACIGLAPLYGMALPRSRKRDQRLDPASHEWDIAVEPKCFCRGISNHGFCSLLRNIITWRKRQASQSLP